MKVESLLENKDKALYCIHPDESMFNCIKILNAKHLGALIVLSPDEEVLGIISERDVLQKIYETKGKLDGITVKDVMTPQDELITASPQDDISVVMEKMTKNNVRHLPILEEGELKGILAIGEVVKFLLDHALEEMKQLKLS
jgi:CBS domain-containing protein